MTNPLNLNLLILEDNPPDAELTVARLRAAGLHFRWQRVDTEADYLAALEGRPDLILADNSIPGYCGLDALLRLQERQLDIPFIVVSGTLDDAEAAECLQRGAADYVLKDRPARLAGAVRRALCEKQLQHDCKRSELLAKTLSGLGQTWGPTVLYSLRINSNGVAVTWASDNVPEVLGYSASEVLQPNWWLSNVHPDDKAQAIAAHLGMAQRRRLVYQYRFRRRDGTWVPLRDEQRLVGEPGHDLLEVAGCWSDLSEQARLDAQVAARTKLLQEQLLRAQRLDSLGALAGGIAHDLNNLLAPILLASQILEMRLNDPEERDLVSRIQTSVHRGSDVLKQVLRFVRGMEDERVMLQPEQLIRELAHIIQEAFPKTITLKLDVPAELSNVTGNATQLEQVLLNLSLNARDAMPNGGFLRISAANVTFDDSDSGLPPGARSGAYVVLRVEDTGTGIPPEVLDKLFEPFFTTKDSGKGTGLGLSTAMGIVKSHCGFIQVRSRPGEGSTFTVGLPATQLSAEPERPRTAGPLPKGDGECVLVVDDESGIRQLLRSLLTSHGYRVLLAGDGVEALNLYLRHAGEIDLVLTDLMMPRMEGPALIQALRRLTPGVKIIAATGSANRHSLDSGGSSGVQALLLKPFRLELLLQTVAEVLAAPLSSGCATAS